MYRREYEPLLIPLHLLRSASAQVKLVQDSASGDIFALKCLKKQRIVNMHQEKNIFAERDAMNMLSHPLILR